MTNTLIWSLGLLLAALLFAPPAYGQWVEGTPCTNCKKGIYGHYYRDTLKPGIFCSNECIAEFESEKAAERYESNPLRHLNKVVGGVAAILVILFGVNYLRGQKRVEKPSWA